jgi:hypothetical protein
VGFSSSFDSGTAFSVVATLSVPAGGFSVLVGALSGVAAFSEVLESASSFEPLLSVFFSCCCCLFRF